tara:strand:- start:1009 stop:3090 length:2082 start_codon:yes stop_codon:yes gene_type:complete
VAVPSLGSLSPLLNYVQGRRNARDLREYRDETLDLRERQLEEMERRARESERLTGEQLDITQQRADALDTQVGIQQDAADRVGEAYDNRSNLSAMMQFIEPGMTVDNAGSSIRITDQAFEDLVNSAPQLFTAALSRSPQARGLRDPDGNPYEQVPNFKRLPDGSFAIEVANQSTSGPLTVGGSTDNAAQLQPIPASRVKAYVESALPEMLANGGYDSPQVRAVLTDRVAQASMARQEVAQNIGDMTGQLGASGAQGAVQQGREILNDIDNWSEDELRSFLVDEMGQTPEEVEAKYPALSEEPQANEGEDRTGLSRDLVKLLEARDRAGNETTIRPGQSGIARVAAAANAKRNTPEQREQDIKDYEAGLEAEIAALEARGPNNPRSRGAFNAKIEAKRRDLAFLNETAVTPDTDLGGIDPPDRTLTLNNMREEIQNGWKPTEAQVNQTADFLRQNGVQQLSDIPNIADRRQATMIAAVLATADSSMKLDQQMATLNGMLNLLQRGDMEYGVDDVIDNDRMFRQLSLDFSKFNAAQIKDFNDLVAGGAADIEKMYELTADREIKWNDARIMAPVAKYRNVYENSIDGSAQQLQAGRVMDELFAHVMKKYALSETRGFFQKMGDIFKRDPDNQVSIDNIADRIVVDTKGETFGFIDTIDGAGKVEGNIPISAMYEIFGRQYTDYVLKKARTRPPVE